jgi:membrane peptidoglycan carboxypeptidase
MAVSLGIKPSELKSVPSEVLGTADVSPLEMAAAYSTFASGGVYHAPLLITKVTTSTGKVLPLPVAPKSRVVLTPDQAALETYVLQQVVLGGTGGAAGGVGSPVAGKTGTTDSSNDAWFIGYTPSLTTAVWMGYADAERTMDGFRGIPRLTGGTVPAILWHDYMAAALGSEPQYTGSFPTVNSFGGVTLSPPAPGTVVFPTTTTTTTTTVPKRTTVPKSSTTKPGSAPTTTKSSPPTTVPSSPPTAKPG